MGLLQEMFSYPFLVRAMIGGICISLCASLLGVSLVLKRYSMIGDGLSHVSFGALSIAVAFNWAPLAVSIPVVAAAAVLLLRIPTCSFHNSPLNAYYKKKRDQGKHHLTATGAVARKLTTVIYAVLRDSKPYEPKKFC